MLLSRFYMKHKFKVLCSRAQWTTLKTNTETVVSLDGEMKYGNVIWNELIRVRLSNLQEELSIVSLIQWEAMSMMERWSVETASIDSLMIEDELKKNSESG